MQSTPYFIKGSNERFSKARTSKIKFLNEILVPEAMVISKRIELLTKFRLYHDMFSSENYQVMNYGIGGKISPHVDSQGQFPQIHTNTYKMFRNYLSIKNVRYAKIILTNVPDAKSKNVRSCRITGTSSENKALSC